MSMLKRLTHPTMIFALIVWALFMVLLCTPTNFNLPEKLEYSEGILSSKKIMMKSGGYELLWLNGDASTAYLCRYGCRSTQGFSIAQYTGERVRIGWVKQSGASSGRRTLVTLEYGGTTIIAREDTLSFRLKEKNSGLPGRIGMGIFVTLMAAGLVYTFMPPKQS